MEQDLINTLLSHNWANYTIKVILVFPPTAKHVLLKAGGINADKIDKQVCTSSSWMKVYKIATKKIEKRCHL
ncbi:MAG: hypothetical protein AB2693_32600 [Candidatus Thiodiazotropha sp.]